MREEAKSQVALTRAERATLALARFINRRSFTKKLQQIWLTRFHQAWVRHAIGRRVFTDNIEWLIRSPPESGTMLCFNHRSYFDAYISMFALFAQSTRWPRQMLFPVRSNFFYERTLGAAVNLFIGGGVLYPPIFRDAAKSELNQEALRHLVWFLGEPGALVGMHPEGTRNKGADPYELLPAQPGIGQIVLHARPVVVPVFVNGLSNSFAGDVAATFRRGVRRDNPVIIVFGQPLDYADLAAAKPRAALYKKMADRIRDAIMELGSREKELRNKCAAGEISQADSGWALNHAFRT